MMNLYNHKELISIILLQASLNWSKKSEPVYVTEESGVVGLNFSPSKEVLIHDSTNDLGNHYDVRTYLKNFHEKSFITWEIYYHT